MSFDSPDFDTLFKIFITALLGYIALVVILRIAGNRTLSKMNSFDFVITISLGSAFATGVLQDAVPLINLVFYFLLVITFQFLVTFFSVRFKTIAKLVKAEPILLFHNGEFLKSQLRKTRVLDAEVRYAVRSQGLSRMEDVGAVVLETNGELSVLKKDDSISESSRPSNELLPPVNRD